MYLIPNKMLLLKAQKEGYAVPAFNIHNLETIQVITEIAAELQSPVILAATPSTYSYAGTNYLVKICQQAAHDLRFPFALHLDHHQDLNDIEHKIKMGVRSIMIDASHLPFKENIQQVTQAVRLAQRYAASVEAELGRLGGREDDHYTAAQDSFYTDPHDAKIFTDQTGIDSLAVAIGTAHGLYQGTPHLDFERLEKIAQHVDIPLVLHGGSGIPDEMVKKAIRFGICKLNVATELKIAFANAIKHYFALHSEADDPRLYLTPAKVAMAKVVKEKIILCNSAGKL